MSVNSVNTQAKTIAQLRRAGYQVLPVREELRKNLMAKIRAEEPVFPGIVGFEDTVIPQLENALLAGQDVILLGERGQAKSRLIRSLTTLLDEFVPRIAGCEINDNPYNPVCRPCRDLVAAQGDRTEIEWISREERYSEKLATPDISIADLIGEIDPIKVAEGRHLSSELVIHYGLVPRTNRGIFSINELPDLAERIQVGLFNLMEERDVQIKGYRIRLPLDVFVVATANPEDYTNRGRIVTPLKDRYGAQIRTHYPRTIEEEMVIMDQERVKFPDESNVVAPGYMKEIIAEITNQARHSNEINQRSGVSVRVSIANFETLLSNAVRRAIRHGDQWACPRISDLPYIVASLAGKIELETFEEGREGKLVEELTKRAVLRVFGQHLELGKLEAVMAFFEAGGAAETGTERRASEYPGLLRVVDGLGAAVRLLAPDETRPEVLASAVEFVLEGLHLNRRVNCERTPVGYKYQK
ncbi:MAG: magnesium chelatase [Dehalococcoidia bacterium]|nr:magnesium chelatase [Dehalococcoidia bacterium]